MGPSTVTLTVSTALAANCSTFTGIFTSCAWAVACITKATKMAATPLMGLILLLAVVLDWLLVQPVDPSLNQLQLTAGNLQRQHHARSGRFTLDPFAPEHPHFEP